MNILKSKYSGFNYYYSAYFKNLAKVSAIRFRMPGFLYGVLHTGQFERRPWQFGQIKCPSVHWKM